MCLFDSHAHYDDARFDADRAKVLSSLSESGVQYVVNAGCDMPSSHASVAMAEEYGFIYAAVGVHPHDAKSVTESDYARLKRLSEHKKVVAIGEIGLDYHYDNSPRDVQREVFVRQIEMAKELNLPFVVHEREALADCLDCLRSAGYYNGVMHCFSGSLETLREILKMGMLISIGGVVTFKNNVRTAEVAKYAPIDSLMLETDCPYLAPHPYRGERNSSAYLGVVAQKIADIRGTDCEMVAQATCDNAKRFFGIT